jgi:hypothetical protein
MVDPDWRTTAKAIGVLHRVSRDAKAQDRLVFATQAAKLKKSRKTKVRRRQNQKRKEGLRQGGHITNTYVVVEKRTQNRTWC